MSSRNEYYARAGGAWEADLPVRSVAWKHINGGSDVGQPKPLRTFFDKPIMADRYHRYVLGVRLIEPIILVE